MNKREMQSATTKQQGFASTTVFIIVLGLGFILSLGFGIWSFIGMQENKSDLDKKIASATAVAVQKAESEKDVEFAEELKNPFKTYKGQETFGTLTFDYPKSWSVFADQKSSGTILDFYGHPDIVPGLSKDVSFALRAQILDNSYDSEVKKFNTSAENGKVTVKAYRPDKVSDVLGVMVSGEIVTGKSGTLILLPQRDKTIKIWTEFDGFLPDFEKVLKSLTFIP